jgi:hypothetical protein
LWKTTKRLCSTSKKCSTFPCCLNVRLQRGVCYVLSCMKRKVVQGLSTDCILINLADIISPPHSSLNVHDGRRCLSDCGSHNLDITLTFWQQMYEDHVMCHAQPKATFRTPGIITTGKLEQGHGVSNPWNLEWHSDPDSHSKLWHHNPAATVTRRGRWNSWACNTKSLSLCGWVTESQPAYPGTQCDVSLRLPLLRYLAFSCIFALRSKK